VSLSNLGGLGWLKALPLPLFLVVQLLASDFVSRWWVSLCLFNGSLTNCLLYYKL